MTTAALKSCVPAAQSALDKNRNVEVITNAQLVPSRAF